MTIEQHGNLYYEFEEYSKFMDLTLFTDEEISRNMIDMPMYVGQSGNNQEEIDIWLNENIEALTYDIISYRKPINHENSSCYGKETLGFDMFTWVSYAGETHNDKIPRILFSKKFKDDLELCSEIQIDLKSKNLKEIFTKNELLNINKWVILNKNILLSFWYDQSINIHKILKGLKL